MHEGRTGARGRALTSSSSSSSDAWGLHHQLTDVADVLHMALKSVPEAERDNAAHPTLRDLYTGVSMTERQLMKVGRTLIKAWGRGCESIGNKHEGRVGNGREGRKEGGPFR